MATIIGDIGIIGVLIFIAWILWIRTASNTDRAQLLESEHVKSLMLIEQKLKTSIMIYCVQCRDSFMGPLTQDGCPKCRTKNFCVPKDDYDRGQYGEKPE